MSKRKTLQSLQNEIDALKKSLLEKENELAEFKKVKEEEIVNLKDTYVQETSAKEVECTTKISELEDRIRTLELQDKEKQRQLDFQETKKMAKAYEDQKHEYRKKSEYWSWALLGISLVLVIYIVVTINILYGKEWRDKIEFYAVDIILFSAVWFCVSQYSYYVKLYSDYANRQVLAQSYYNIINSEEDSEIKSKFIEKTTEVLCAKNGIDHKDNLPVEKLLNNAMDITKEAIKKIPS